MNQIFLCRYFEKKINAAIFLLKTERGSLVNSHCKSMLNVERERTNN